jgi:hypothetical protein
MDSSYFIYLRRELLIRKESLKKQCVGVESNIEYNNNNEQKQ